MSKILVIAAHPDDELLGLGATIKKRVDRGDVANCIILGEGMTSRKNKREDVEGILINQLHENSRKAAKIIGFENIYFEKLPDNRFDGIEMLDIIKTIEGYIAKLKPDIVYTHHKGDRNIDHRITHEAVLTACRPVGDYTVKEIYAFETSSSTEWGFSKEESFFPNIFEDVSNTLSFKLEAMKCYETEIREYPHPRSLKSLEIIAARWGSVVGVDYAEAFMLIRSTRD